MKYSPPPMTYSERIRSMEPKTVIQFKKAELLSIRVLASRIAAKEGRKYRTAGEDGVVTVWRDK